MSKPFFYPRPPGFSLGEIATWTGARPPEGAALDRRLDDVAPLDRAGPRHLSFLDNAKFLDELKNTGAGACLVPERFAGDVPAGAVAFVSAEPYRAFIAVTRRLYPDAMRPSSLFEAAGVQAGAAVHPTARLEAGVTIDPGAVVGPRAEIGAGTMIAASTTVGPGVRIGRDCVIGPGVSLQHALIGDRVIVHPGCQIGQDGFGYQFERGRHVKIPQTGRVIIQNDVEIGANTTVDRGGTRDTVIGEGTKIDNLVQIGHNVAIGRHCILVAQTGISGSATLEDYVVLGARVGVGNQFTVGEGAQIAALSVVASDVPAGARWGGFPAKPVQLWIRETKMVERLAAQKYGVSVQERKGRPTPTDE